jgi:signal transduction histidine kinase
MRERARAVGGSVLTVAQNDGTWRVAARLPLQVAT